MPDYLGELKEKFMDMAVEEYSKPKAVRDRFRAYVEQLMDSPGNFDRAIKYIRMIEPMTNMANRFVQNNYISKFKKAGGKIILHSAMGERSSPDISPPRASRGYNSGSDDRRQKCVCVVPLADL